MNQLTMEELQTLTNEHEHWCISIFMPAIEKSKEVRQNAIRFKNLLDEAASQLKVAGLNTGEIDQLFEQAHNLIKDNTFWQYQDQGLAVLFSEHIFQTYQLPVAVEEQAIVSKRFYIKPLLPLLYGEGEFYILTLDQKEIRVIKATEHSAEEIEVPGMPKDMQDALQWDTPEDQVTFHTGTAEPGAKTGFGERPAMFHGHGGIEEDKKRDLKQYFDKVDKVMSKFLTDRRSPLVVAGVEYFLPIYKDANTYLHLVDAIIPGNPRDISAEQLRDQAWPMVKPLFDITRDEIVGRYKQLAGGQDERAIKDLKEVVKAAPFGRVEVLFVDKNAKKWGTFDANNVEVNFEEEPRAENQDLIDFAAVQTLLNGGIVYAVDTEDLPEQDTPVAAIFRY